jgi:hypothetical protein
VVPASVEVILQWLEIESNFNWLNGEATKGMKMVVAGAKVSKASALQDLADHVNEKCGTKWHKDKARETLRSYKDIYKKTMWYISIKAMKLIEAGKDPKQTKAFLNALGSMKTAKPSSKYEDGKTASLFVHVIEVLTVSFKLKTRKFQIKSYSSS